jgi:N-acetylmuramoyl-L-alanine amidase
MRTALFAWIPIAGLSLSLAFADPGDRLYDQGRSELFSSRNVTDLNVRRNKLKKASSDLRKFLDLYANHPKRAEVVFDLGSVYSDLADLDNDRDAAVRALNYYRDLVRTFPKDRLADDSLYRISEICRKVFQDKPCADEAKQRILKEYGEGDMIQKVAGAPALSPPASPPPSVAETGAATLLTEMTVERFPSEIVIRIKGVQPKGFSANHLAADPQAKLPERFYVDVEQARADPGLKPPAFTEADPVTQVRLGRTSTAARIVLDLSADTKSAGITAQWEGEELRIRVRRAAPAESVSVAENQTPVSKAEKTEAVLNELKAAMRKPVRLKIVLDAGHGGDDTGARGRKGTLEKDICLDIVKRIEELLRKRSEYDIVLTRNDDRFVPLSDRTKFANEMHGDLFVSVHANAAPRKSAQGVSTYFLDNHDDEESLRVAMQENQVLGGMPLGKMPASDDQYLEIMKASMAKNFHTVQSTELARTIQIALLKDLRHGFSDVDDLGVRSARFYVLTGAQMPAVLIETSFISNAREEKRLRDPKYQKSMAQAVVRGIDQFFRSSVGRGDHAALYQN